MADESVRSLLATLGFEVDTTGADQFEARFKKLGTTIGTIAKKIDGINPKFDKKKGIARGKSFGFAVKKAFLTAIKLDKKIPGFDPKFKTGKGQERSRKIGRKIKESFLKALKIIKKIPGFDPKFKTGKGVKRATTFGEKIKIAFLRSLKIEEEGFNKFTKSIKTGLSKVFKKAKITAISGASGIAKVIRKNIKFKSLPELEKSLGEGLKKVFKKAKITALAGVAAIAATIGKGFLKFTDVESARFALRFQAENLGVDFDKILKKLKDVKKETGNVVDELDILQALNVGFTLTQDFESVAKNMSNVIKFSSVLNKDLSEVQHQFSEFILTGENLKELKKFGFFDQAQIEALKKAGTGFGPLAEKARAQILDEKIAEQVDRLNKAFKEFGGTNAAFVARMKVIFSGGLIQIGEETTTSIKKAVETDDVVELFRKGAKETFGEFKSDINKVINFFSDITSGTPTGTKIPLSKTIPFKNLERFTPPGLGGPQPQRNIINQTNTVNINGGDTEMVRKVVGEVIKDAAQIELIKTPDTALPTRSQ